MKSFREFIAEDVVPVASSNGSIDIDNPEVRSQINTILAGVTTKSCVTPYYALTHIRKALAYFHIHLPKKTYLEGQKGVEVWEIHQFGERMGVNDKGEWIDHVPAKYHLFFQYMSVGSMYFVTAKIVDRGELDKHLDNAEKMVSEAKEKKPVKPVKPVNLTPEQEQDVKIPNSIAAYRDRIYKARMKQFLRKEQIEEDAEAQLEKSKSLAPEEEMHVLKKKIVKEAKDSYAAYQRRMNAAPNWSKEGEWSKKMKKQEREFTKAKKASEDRKKAKEQIDEVSLGDYKLKAQISKSRAETAKRKAFGQHADFISGTKYDKTIEKRKKGLSLAKEDIDQIDELYGKGKLGAITRANYDKAKQHHLGSTHPENPHGQSVSRGNELLRIKNDDAWYKKNGGRGFKRTSKDYETSHMHRDAKKEFLKKHGPTEE